MAEMTTGKQVYAEYVEAQYVEPTPSTADRIAEVAREVQVEGWAEADGENCLRIIARSVAWEIAGLKPLDGNDWINTATGIIQKMLERLSSVASPPTSPDSAARKALSASSLWEFLVEAGQVTQTKEFVPVVIISQEGLRAAFAKFTPSPATSPGPQDVRYTTPPSLPEGAQDARLVRMANHCCIPEIDEPFFVLLGRDPQAPGLVEKWALDRQYCEPAEDEKWTSAAKTAVEMRAWKLAHPERGMSMEAFARIPDALPEGAREALERARTIALEQRCERGTPWDFACVAIANKIGEQFGAVPLPSPKPPTPSSAGLIEAAEWHEQKADEHSTRNFADQSVVRWHEDSAAYLRARAADRSAT